MDYKPSAADVKSLREQTGAGMLEVRNVLVETEGDIERAKQLLRERGVAKAAKRGGRVTSEGKIGAYIHGGKKGVLVEVGCETDFVGNSDEFNAFVKDTRWVKIDDVPAEARDAELDIYRKQAAEEGKPEPVQQKIAEGRLRKWYEAVCLLEQPWFRDEDISVEQARAALSAKTGENIEIKRFARFELGRD